MQTTSQDADDREPKYLSTEQLYRAHRPFVARFLTRLGVRPDALDDAVQEVFVTVHRRGGYVVGPAKPTSYLATIAINTAAAQRRSARKLAARRGEQEPEEIAARGCDPGKAFETRQELCRLDRALSRLDPTLRDTLLAADGEGETCVAIADATSVPLGTVYWRLDRARKKFREALRTVDGPQRRRTGMFVTLFGIADWRRFAKQLPGLKVGLGVGALLASLTFWTLRGEAPVVVPPAPAIARPTAPTLAAAAHTPVATAIAETPTLEPAPSRVKRTRRRVVDTSVAPTTLASAPTIRTAPSVNTAEAAPAKEPAREASETAQLARAEALLRDHPRDALALVRSLDHREHANYLHEERDYIETMALLAIEPKRGQERAAAFLRAYPSSAFARLVRARSR